MTKFENLTLAEQQAWRRKARKAMYRLKRMHKKGCVSLRYNGPDSAIAQNLMDYGDKPIVLGIVDLTPKHGR